MGNIQVINERYIVREGERELLPDLAKGIAIFLVVWGHAIQYFHGINYDYWHDVIFEIIYGFHMPVFALISGYLMAKTYDVRKPKQQILKKAKQLLLPYFVWGFILSLISSFLDLRIQGFNLYEFILLVAKGTITSPLWFLLAIFIGECTIIVGQCISKSRFQIVFYVTVILSTLFWTRLHTAGFVLSFFIIGFGISNLKFKYIYIYINAYIYFNDYVLDKGLLHIYNGIKYIR